MRYSALILILLAGSIPADESKDGNSYLCVPDKAVGFSFNDDTKTWDHADFRVGDDKYVVRPVTADDTYYGRPIKQPYAVWKLGEDAPDIRCDEGISDANWLHCGVGNTLFVLNTQSNRYMLTFHGGYMIATFDFRTDDDGELITFDKQDAGGDTPYMEIGKCSKI